MTGLDFFDDDELVHTFGAATLHRARSYAEAGQVGPVEEVEAHKRLLMLTGRVQGTRATPYSVTVSIVDPDKAPWVDSRCTCPVGRLCKHAAAVILVARSNGTGSAGWSRELGLVLDELDEAAERSSGSRTPLALQVELTAPARARASWQSPAVSLRGHLKVRPLQRGARDKWVKTGVTWIDVPYLELRAAHVDAHARVLAELLADYRSTSRLTYIPNEPQLSVSAMGPGLWRILGQAAEAGLELVPAGALRSVRVLPEPVAVTVDVNGGDSARAAVSLGVRVEDDWYAGTDLDVLGPASAGGGHGVALWSPAARGWDLLLAPLTRPVGPHTRRLLGRQPTEVPGGDVPDLVEDLLPRLQRHLPVTSSDASVRVPAAAEPRLVLTVTWKAVDEVHVGWSFRYRVGEDDRIYALHESRGLRGVRRPEEEQALVAALELDEEQVHRLFGAHRRDHGLVPEQVFRGMQAVAFVEDTLVPLEASGQVEIEELGPRPDYQEATEAPVIRFAPRSPDVADEDASAVPEQRTDWLDLEVVVTVGKHAIGLATLIEALTLGAERLILSNGVHLRLDRPEFDRLRAVIREARELTDQPGDGVRVGKHDLGLWDELAEIGLVDAQAGQWVAAARSLRDLKGLPEVEPTEVDAELRHYQLEGFRWLTMLWQHGLGGVLADDMGLGKTLQTLALVAHARAAGAGPFLVVAPTSVVGAWAAEAATFTPGLRVRTVTESRSRRGTAFEDVYAGADVVVTSYTLLRLEIEDYVAQDWGGLILDEAQMVKNHTSKTYQCVRRVEAPFRLALTGTPMENRLMDLWSLLSIVAPGLYPYPRRFIEHVANPIEREGDTATLERFRRRIKPFLLRRTKELVASDLPPKQEQVLEVQLTPKHRRVYDLHLQHERQHVLGLLGDFERRRVAIFRSLTKLRQLSLDAALVDPEHDGVGSAKIDVLVDHLQEVIAEGHRALVFSQFTSFLTRVRKRLDAEGITSTYLDGRTRRRAEVVQEFKQGKGEVFLISLKAGGTGLTLTEADYVFVLDPWWNPAVEAQAVDRAHRIGQHRPVIVYRLVSQNTIEEKVMALKARKAKLFEGVVDGEGGAGTPLTAEDIRALLED